MRVYKGREMNQMIELLFNKTVEYSQTIKAHIICVLSTNEDINLFYRK